MGWMGHSGRADGECVVDWQGVRMDEWHRLLACLFGYVGGDICRRARRGGCARLRGRETPEAEEEEEGEEEELPCLKWCDVYGWKLDEREADVNL